MTRPRAKRCIGFSPCTCYFAPADASNNREVKLQPDELEAMRLRDVEDLDQTTAAKQMQISQPTFARILRSAHQKVAQALVHGQAIRLTIEGD